MESLKCMSGSVTGTKFYWTSTCMLVNRTKITWEEFAGSADGWTAAELEKGFFGAVLSSHVCRTRDSSNRTTCVVRLDAWEKTLNWSQVLGWRGTFPCSFLFLFDLLTTCYIGVGPIFDTQGNHLSSLARDYVLMPLKAARARASASPRMLSSNNFQRQTLSINNSWKRPKFDETMKITWVSTSSWNFAAPEVLGIYNIYILYRVPPFMESSKWGFDKIWRCKVDIHRTKHWNLANKPAIHVTSANQTRHLEIHNH